MTDKFPPTHPGQILLEEFLEPLGVSPVKLAQDIGVTPRRINDLIKGRQPVTAEIALRL